MFEWLCSLDMMKLYCTLHQAAAELASWPGTNRCLYPDCPHYKICCEAPLNASKSEPQIPLCAGLLNVSRMLWFDLIIAIAYFAIPLELVYCFWFYPFSIRTKPAVVGSLFVTFITLCGRYNDPIPVRDCIMAGSWPKHVTVPAGLINDWQLLRKRRA